MGPVGAAADVDADVITELAHQQPIAIVLDFMNSHCALAGTREASVGRHGAMRPGVGFMRD
jgi:hypothetical protein